MFLNVVRQKTSAGQDFDGCAVLDFHMGDGKWFPISDQTINVRFFEP